ncbi:glycoside hydrolase [Acephala macrosclerotiorum]|nr:glycoside hydrolase [Acephala macrosclerotiorum]
MSPNGGGEAEVVLADTTTAASPWANATASQVLLNAGNNTISFNFIDCIYVTPSPPPAPHKATNSLVDPKALPVTKALFETLSAQHGSGDIFSGQADPTGITWLETNIDKTPAILGLDMIDYSPTLVVCWQVTSPRLVLTFYRSTEQQAPLVSPLLTVQTLSYLKIHSGLINNATVPWWDGIYTYGTTFNLTAALANTSSTNYGLLSDMDDIAVELLRLQAANIPILWRPLHEADGGWFWWGAWGPESCKTLYRLMFDRYTNYHDLHNLIWLCNSVNPSWYPRAYVVDILGYDSYPAIGDHGPVSAQYQDLIALRLDEKIATLPEVGNIPDPTLLKLYHADWSYFVTWDQDYITTDTYNNLTFKQMVYDDAMVLKLTDPGAWDGTAVVAPTSSVATSSASPTSTSKSSSTSAPQTLSSSSSSSTNISTTLASSTSYSSTSSKASITSSAAAAVQNYWGRCGGLT